jgi:DNA-binding PadR family transcriptional regulator
LLDSHLLDPLRGDGYVETYKQGRNKYVEATEEGQNTLEAFAYMIDAGE